MKFLAAAVQRMQPEQTDIQTDLTEIIKKCVLSCGLMNMVAHFSPNINVNTVQSDNNLKISSRGLAFNF